jgi:two-component system, NarL family, response regulator LiaR
VNSRPTTGPKPEAGHGAVSVLVADGDVLARKALRDGLSQAGLSVVGQAADASHAVALAKRCVPEVALIDAALPPDGGVTAMQALVAATPDIRVVILAREDGGDAGLRALSRGAVGYLSRDVDLMSLARALERVTAGEAAISRSLATHLVERLCRLSAGLSGMRPVRSPLTTREWEVLDLLRAGATTAQIAKELVVSPETVHSHVQHIFRKLHARSRAEAVEIAEGSRMRPGTSGRGAPPGG